MGFVTIGEYTWNRPASMMLPGGVRKTYAYDYDDLYRLTAADNPTETDEAFTYNTVGNRLTSTDTTSSWD